MILSTLTPPVYKHVYHIIGCPKKQPLFLEISLQFPFDPQKLVVFRRPFRAAGRAGLDLSRVDSHRQTRVCHFLRHIEIKISLFCKVFLAFFTFL